MKRLLALAALLLSTGVLSALQTGALAATRPHAHVDIKDNPAVDGEFRYLPKRLTIKVGTKVTWRNQSSQPHSVTDQEAQPRFNSGDVDHLIQPGQNWSHIFRHAGTFTYYCIIHPDMKGKIIVVR
jgi:plastocyanin